MATYALTLLQRSSLALVGLVVSCTFQRTQTVVEIRADQNIAAQATEIRIEVRDAVDAVVFSHVVAPQSADFAGFPLTVPVSAKRGDGARRFELRVQALRIERRGTGLFTDTLAENRLRTSFVAGQVVRVALWLLSDCRCNVETERCEPDGDRDGVPECVPVEFEANDAGVGSYDASLDTAGDTDDASDAADAPAIDAARLDAHRDAPFDAARESAIDGGETGPNTRDGAQEAATDGGATLLTPIEVTSATLLDPGARRAQINGASARDGDHLWIVYVATAATSNNLAIWLMRTDLLGTPTLEPMQLNTRDGNCGNSQITRHLEGGTTRFLVAWHCSDVPGLPQGFHTFYKLLTSSGAAVTTDIRLETQHASTTVDSHAAPTVASHPSRGLFIAGVRFVPPRNDLTPFVQRISTAGSLVGIADEWTTSSAELIGITIGFGGDSYMVAFDRDEHSMVFREGSGEVQLGLGRWPAIAYDAQRAVAAYSSDSGDIAVHDVTSTVSPQPAFRVAAISGNALSPVLAMDGTGGGSLIWLQREAQTVRGRILGVRFDRTGSVSGEYLLINRSVVSTYTPMLVHVGGERFLLGWSEGSGSNLQMLTAVVEMR